MLLQGGGAGWWLLYSWQQLAYGLMLVLEKWLVTLSGLQCTLLHTQLVLCHHAAHTAPSHRQTDHDITDYYLPPFTSFGNWNWKKAKFIWIFIKITHDLSVETNIRIFSSEYWYSYSIHGHFQNLNIIRIFEYFGINIQK